MLKTKISLLGFLIAFGSHSTNAQNGLNFDPSGTADFVQTTYAGVTGTANRTFEAWIYLNTTPTSNLSISDYGLNAVGSRNTFFVNANLAIGFISGGTNANITSTSNAVSVGQWVHVAFVLDNATGYLYVDGVQVGTGSLSSVDTPPGNVNLRIGQRVSGGSIPFNGVIDEYRIWDVARTAQEISANMNSEFCIIPAGLMAYYKLNHGIAGGTNSTVTTAVEEVAGANGALMNFSLNGAASNWVTGAALSQGAVVNNQTLNECAGFSITVGSNTYSSTGNYSDTLFTGSSNGCDSIINTDLTIDPAIDITLTKTSPMLMSNQAGASYQWLDCDASFQVIPGETNQSFTASISGNYAVEITMGNCVDTSACDTIDISNVGIIELNQKTVSVYPNPTHNTIQIDLGGNIEDLKYSLLTIDGKVIRENTLLNTNSFSLDISSEPKGLYFLKLNNFTYKVIKE